MKDFNKGLPAVNWIFFPIFPLFVFVFCLGRIVSIFTKSSSGKLTEELEVMLTVNKFYRYFNVSIY